MNLNDDFTDSTPVSEFFNDAELWGNECPEYEAMLMRPATLLTGEVWGAKDRRNTQDGEWKPVELTWAQWLIGAEGSKALPAWGFTRHPTGKHKEGACIVLGSSIGGARKAKAMDSMYAMGLDIDSGASLDSVLDRIEKLGLLCLVYTSFNHGKTVLHLKRDDVMRKLHLTAEPTREDVQTYLREFDKSRYEESFIAAVEITEGKHQTKEGTVIALRTPPLEKFRLIFPLAEPVKLIELASTQTAALDVWEDKITGLAQNVLGVNFDTSCTDPSRLFYTARHAKSAEDWYCAVVRGRPLTFEEITPMKKATYVGAQDSNAFTVAGGGSGEVANRAPDCVTPSGRSLNEWHHHAKGRFQIADLLEAYCTDKIRVAGGEASGHVHTECPFEHEHSTEGGTATMAVNALDSESDYWTWFCHHDACQGRHKLAFLEEALRAGWFDEKLLYKDGGYLLDGEEDEEADALLTDAQIAERDARARAAGGYEDPRDWLPKGYKIKGGTIHQADEEGDVPLCQAFDVIGNSSNMDGDAGAGVIIAFVNRFGIEVELTLDARELIQDKGGDIIGRMADAAMQLYVDGKHSRDRFLSFLRRIRATRRIPTSPRPGWLRDRAGKVTGFLCPTGEFIAAGGDPVRLHSDATVQDTRPMGSMEGWKQAASAAMNTENFYWTLGIAAGFVGPLMGLVGGEPCGFYLSGKTSLGKSQAGVLAVSAWGATSDKRGLFFSGSMTANAVEDIATMATGATFALDEIGAMQNVKDLGSILFGLSTGAGKARKAGRGAGLAASAEFQTFVLLTYEHPLRATIESAGGVYKDGLSVRFPNVSVADGVTVDESTMDAIKACARNFGHAGPAFVQWLIAKGYQERPEALQERLAELVTEIVGAGAPSALRRAGRVFALAALAGELAAEAGLIDGGKVLGAVRRAYEAFADADEGKAVSGDEALLDAFRAWITSELGAAIIDGADADAPRYRSVIGWHTDAQIVLMWDKLKNLDKLGINGTRDALVKALRQSGAIELSGKNNFHNALPGDVKMAGGASERKVANLRIRRDVLGV